MSLLFSGANSHRVNVGADARLTGATDLTVWGWVRASSLIGGRAIIEKSRDGSGNLAWVFRLDGGGGNVGLIRQAGSGLNQLVTTNDTPLTTGAWYFVAVTAEWGSAAGAIYVGTLASLAASRGLLENTTGGTQATDSGGGLIIGNRNSNNAGLPGEISVVGVHPRVLSLSELHAIQFDPRVLGDGPLYRLGDNGTGTQRDLSGSGLGGTVTGATRSADAPLRRWRRAGGMWVGVTSAISVEGEVTIPAEWLAVAEGGADVPLEHLAAVAGAAGIPAEQVQALAGVAPVALESLAAVLATAAAPTESLATALGAVTIPTESLAARVATAALPLEHLRALGVVGTLPIESLASLAGTVTVPAEQLQGIGGVVVLPLDWLGTAVLQGVAVVPLEWLGVAAAGSSSPLESLAHRATQATAQVEALAGRSGAVTVPLSPLGGLSALAHVPTEWLAARLAAAGLPLEILAEVEQATGIPAEILQGLDGVTTLPLDWMFTGQLYELVRMEQVVLLLPRAADMTLAQPRVTGATLTTPRATAVALTF